MPKAIANIFPATCEHKTTEIEAISFDYLDDSNIRMPIRTGTGDVVVFTMNAAVFLRALRAADEAYQSHVWEMLSSLKLT